MAGDGTAPRAQTPDGVHLAHRALRRVLESRFVAALAAPHGIDHHLLTVGAAWATAHPPARIVEARRTTPRTVTLTLRPGAPWPGHRPGQHVRLMLPVAGARRSRCFSIASSAHRRDGLVELTVKATGAGGVSDRLVAAARPGWTVELSPPAGEFTLPAERPPHVVLVSGGSGITPVLSMLRTLDDEGYPGIVSFLHYARRRRDVVAGAELAEIARRHPGWRVVVSLTALGSAGDAGRAGRFRPDHLATLGSGALDAPDAPAWVCGPDTLAADVAAARRAAGSPAPVHVERYRLGLLAPMAAGPGATGAAGTTGTTGTAATGTAAARVRFMHSGVEVVDDGRVLLEQAEAAGLAPDHGCRAGHCHTCIRRKPTGAVRDVRTGDVIDEPDVLVQLCVTVPDGHVEIDL
jgi:ferredoxin-NADP reductase